MGAIRKFEDIQAWQDARDLTARVYGICRERPLAHDFGLRDQIRRSAISIQSNIAEGFGREGNKEFLRFLKIAKGSCNEFRSQLYSLLDVDYITRDQFDSFETLSIQVEKRIGGLIHYLKTQIKAASGAQASESPAPYETSHNPLATDPGTTQHRPNDT